MNRIAAIGASALWLVIGLGARAEACVGRKLVLGAVDDPRQAMAGRVLSILVNERTGTTVEMRFFASETELLAEVSRGKVDLFVDAVDAAARRSGLALEGQDAEARYLAVKRKSDEEANLVWLRPMGHSGRDAAGRPTGQAAAVARKETLKKFPALPRLIEKLGSGVAFDDAILDGLVRKAGRDRQAQVARDWLKEVRLI